MGGGTPKYSAIGLPAGLKISTSTGAITGTVALGDAASGPYTVTVTANDGTYSAEVTFTWTINGPVSIVLPPDQTNIEGDTVSLSVSASDSSMGTLKYSAAGLPAGLKINTGTGAITGTVAAGDAETGLYAVTVTASDGTYRSSTTFNWTINCPVTIADPDDTQVFDQGDTVSVQVEASGSGTLFTYIAYVGCRLAFSMNSSTGLISGTISSSTDSAGVFESLIGVTNGTSIAYQPITWTIRAPSFNLRDTLAFNGNIGALQMALAGSILSQPAPEPELPKGPPEKFSDTPVKSDAKNGTSWKVGVTPARRRGLGNNRWRGINILYLFAGDEKGNRAGAMQMGVRQECCCDGTKQDGGFERSSPVQS